jgi:hypothetical protein
VTFRWSNAPCPAAVGIGTYRFDFSLPHGYIRLLLVAERGPFAVSSTTETVTLSPSIPVHLGDLIAIRNLTPCGFPTGLSNTSSASALVLVGSSFPPDYSPEPQPGQTLPIQVAVQGGGTVNTSVIPVVISSGGQHSSFWRTSLQLYNRASSSSPAVGRLIFRGEAQYRNDSISLPYSLEPGSVLAIPDLLSAMGISGLGSLDIVPDTGPPPAGMARIYNDLGAAGTAGFTEDLLNESAALSAGDVAVLIAPSDPVAFRFNIGVRSINRVTFTATLRDSSGIIRGSATHSFAEEGMLQDTASRFLSNVFGCSSCGDETGPAVGPSATVTIEVKSGNVFVYGVAADNLNNDSSFELAQRVPPIP